jgi:hypothetical protein
MVVVRMFDRPYRDSTAAKFLHQVNDQRRFPAVFPADDMQSLHRSGFPSVCASSI